MPEMYILTSLRDAMLAYSRDKNLSGREASKALGLTPQFNEYTNGKRKMIRSETVKNMLPLLERYLEEDEIEYYRSSGRIGDVMVLLVRRHTGVSEQLAEWIEYEASEDDRKALIHTARSMGFEPCALPKSEEVEEVEEVEEERGFRDGDESVESFIEKQKTKPISKNKK